MESIWKVRVTKPSFEALHGNKHTDVLIIGGGVAGILCAHTLCHAGVDCVLVEADSICGGTTADTTAKITLGQRLIYDMMCRRFGEDKTARYLEA